MTKHYRYIGKSAAGKRIFDSLIGTCKDWGGGKRSTGLVAGFTLAGFTVTEPEGVDVIALDFRGAPAAHIAQAKRAMMLREKMGGAQTYDEGQEVQAVFGAVFEPIHPDEWY